MRRLGVLVLVTATAACGSSSHGTIDGGGGGGDGGPGTPDAFAGPYSDFPTDPIIDTPSGGTTTPPGAPGLFGDPSNGAQTGGPCLMDPQIGTMFPNNWLRPRFTWAPVGGENLFELRLTAANEVNPLIVYTTGTSWTMPKAMWSALSSHIVDAPITVSVRGATWDGNQLTSGPELGSKGDISIAPVDAPGAIVYWTTSGGTILRGFHVGDESVTDIVTPSGAGTQCVGCHSSTPDGAYVGFAASSNPGNGNPAGLGLRSADGTESQPAFLTTAAQTLMAREYQELPVFSSSHWKAGDHTGVTMFQVNNRWEIMWTDLEATSTNQDEGWGVVARTGDANNAAYASFAHTSDTLVYVSSPDVAAGVTVQHGDVAVVPYGDRAGGTYHTIAGADTATYNEYYPTFSPDDAWIAFSRVPDGQSSYNNGQAEVFVISALGGTPVRLDANDPPACTGLSSPGITNSWPKWSPEATSLGGKRYYWLTFSSTRTGLPQLYVTPVVDDGQTLTTYPALYLWNQPADEKNHTPAWDNFNIPVN